MVGTDGSDLFPARPAATFPFFFQPSLNPPAPAHLEQLITDSGGWLSFEAFMAGALYSPSHGYYTRHLREIGRRGDFSTAAGPGSLLARAIARWAWRERKGVRQGAAWHLIEIGGGNGLLAREILSSLGWLGRRGLVYHLVEISHTLKKLQQARLGRFRVAWHERIEEALAAAEGRAVIFSNELVDAFPCARLRWQDDQWQEMGICWENGRAVEALRPLDAVQSASLQGSALKNIPRQDSRQVVEIHRAYRRHLEQLTAGLQAGVLLTIDYGDTFPELYHRQPHGTVRGYFHHLRLDGNDLYDRFGHQDLTADVNFTDLQNWGAELGLQNESYQTQREFILRWVRKAEIENTLNARLLDPIGAGTAFKVLQQARR